MNWTVEDAITGLCHVDQVGSPKPVAPPTEPEVSDDDLLSDLGLARRLYRKDPERFIASHASVANKLLDIQEKAQSSAGYPPLTDLDAWNKLLTKIGKEASAMDVSTLPSTVLLLYMLHKASGNLTDFKESLRPHADIPPP